MSLDPTPDASLLSLAADLETRSAALRATAAHDARLLAESNRNSNGAMTQVQGPAEDLSYSEALARRCYGIPPDQIKVEDTPLRLQVPCRCVPGGTSVWDTVTWETRDAKIVDKDGNTVFEQRHVRVPSTWSQTAVNVVASKYFRLVHGVRETGVDQMIQRVSATITEWGIRDGYFDTETAAVFAAELQYLLLHQMAAFNSPVWFNIGVPGVDQSASACYILSVEDSMEGILEWYRQEGMIFSRGAGAGVNISSLRSKKEPISKGGYSSGPMSFSRAADASAFSIKSGGTTRRSARMLVMNADHPDIEDFIHAKSREETKARVLQAAGYDDSLDGEIYATVAHQNCNMSVSVTDAFLDAVEQDQLWELRYVTTGAVADRVPARDLFRQMAQATWSCGDPGAQYNDTMNRWHTCPSSGSINSTNPCGEYQFLDNTACNLSSLNLLKFLRDDGIFDTDTFRHAVAIMITAKEILVSRASYPTEAITRNSHEYRTLGIGYANLGALLMAKGLPYDSEDGREYAASITALMTGEAYAQSARLAQVHGPFEGYAANQEPMSVVLRKHEAACNTLQRSPLTNVARLAWREALALGARYGYRNAQVSLLAPTGTISIMMDCSTTGLEPDVALVNYKALVGGGTIKKVNEVVPQALRHLGYGDVAIQRAQAYIEAHGTLEGCPAIHEAHLPVFDCAFPTTPDGRSIHYEGHIRMVAAVQPFLSGSASKTINMPQDATVEDIESAYLLGWRLGCKSLAIYRDGCKATQVLTTKQPATPASAPGATPSRRRLPDERAALTHKFQIGDQEGYVTVGLYDDGTPGEVFIRMAKEGSTISGLIDAFATSISMALQYGVPLRALCDKFRYSRFAPAGFTPHPQIRMATSVTDYIFHYLALKFLDPDPVTVTSQDQDLALETDAGSGSGAVVHGTSCCSLCGGLLRISGSCSVCTCCGTSMGCS